MGKSQNIPQAVEKLLGNIFPISLLGIRNGIEYYRDILPEDAETGFPTVVAYQHDSIVHVYCEFEALRIISSFVK